MLPDVREVPEDSCGFSFTWCHLCREERSSSPRGSESLNAKVSPSLRPGSANLQLSAGLHPSHPPLFPLSSSTLLCLPYNLNLLLIFFPHGRKYSSVQRGSEAEATVARNWRRNSRRRREQKSRREGGKREREREKLPDTVRQPREEASNRLATTTVQQTHVRECPTADSIVTLMLNIIIKTREHQPSIVILHWEVLWETDWVCSCVSFGKLQKKTGGAAGGGDVVLHEKLKSMQPNSYKFRVIPQFTDEHKSQHLSTVCSCCCNQTFIYTFIYVLDSGAGQLLGTIMKKQVR